MLWKIRTYEEASALFEECLPEFEWSGAFWCLLAYYKKQQETASQLTALHTLQLQSLIKMPPRYGGYLTMLPMILRVMRGITVLVKNTLVKKLI